jgi:fructokinase
MSARCIVGVGELLWDEFETGRRLGGAPANFTYHAAALGDRSMLLGRVGRDELGDAALKELGERGVSTELIQGDEERKTGTSRVKVHAAKVEFEIDGDAAWAAPAWTDAWAKAAAGADAIGFGTLLASTSAGRHILEKLKAAAPGALRLLDLNLRPPLTTGEAIDAALACANALKVSEDEEVSLRRRLGARDLAEWALGRGYRALAITRGNRGCTLFTPRGRADQTGLEVDTSAGDPVGAGDAFAAALVHHLVRSDDPERISRAANRYAAFVASRPGAMPAIDEAVRAAVMASDADGGNADQK